MKQALLTVFIVGVVGLYADAQKYQPDWNSLNKRWIPGWFNDAKFGIFIHWGVYSVPAFAPVIANSGESYAEWYWMGLRNKDRKSHDIIKSFQEKNYGENAHYADFEKQFTASLFDPAQWAKIFRQSGAKYVVLTSKHHEGYCLWNSPWADTAWGRPWNAVTGTPKRDLLGDLTNAVRNEGLRMGFYYSLYEWFNPLWLTDRQLYIKKVMTPEFKDLVTRYKPSVIFSDGEWDLPDTAWHSPELLAWLFNDSPVKDDVVVNDRWGSNTRGKNTGSTYSTSEYGSGMEPNVVWEESQGIGHSYGYNRMEALEDYKSSAHLILSLVDIVSRGGNLLLDIGPTADGRIPVIMQQRLADIGSWLKINGEAIYDTRAWTTTRQWSTGPVPKANDAAFMAGYDVTKLIEPDKNHAHIEMFFTRKDKDLFCFVPRAPRKISIKGLRIKKGTEVSLLGYNNKIQWTQKGNNVEISIPSLNEERIDAPLVFRLQNAL